MKRPALDVRRAIGVLLGLALIGVGFFVAATAAGELQCCTIPPPLWLAFVFAVTPIVFGSIVLAVSLALLGAALISNATPERTAWGQCRVDFAIAVSRNLLLLLGSGLAIVGLLFSSAFFYGCGSAVSCQQVPIRPAELSAAANLCYAGIVLLVLAGVPQALVLIRRLRTATQFMPGHESTSFGLGK